MKKNLVSLAGILLFGGLTLITSVHADEVLISTDKVEYEQGEVIKTTIRNVLDKSIWYLDFPQPDLKFWGIERFEDDRWQDLAYTEDGGFRLPIKEEGKEVCYILLYERPIGHVVELKSDSEISFEWNQRICPGKMVLQKQPFEPVFIEEGRYRFIFPYGLSTRRLTKPQEEPWKKAVGLAQINRVYSNEFTINQEAISTALAADNEAIVEQIDILKTKDAEHREKWQAKENLVRIGGDAVLPLIDALKDKNAKYYAIRALGEIKDERAVKALSEILLEKNYGPRRYAAIALGRIGSAKAIPALKEALKDVRHVKRDALLALAQIDAPQARKIMTEMYFKQEPNGLEIEISLADSKDTIYKDGDSLKINVVFKNISPSDYYIHYPGIYKAIFLIAKDERGKIVEPLRIVEYICD